ncbi:BQ5605_C026g10235 [Microbotryum silenes-dioicae]|uniref:BQ5605_C026g10235 protein n=1 Tax=Microbotryum silenes-dioicae TaxID=796604 RepID=A0A2X0MRK1_9BASI|nr:BQ5605_C026g10235 [Microbotryum silenes-dioicae]
MPIYLAKSDQVKGIEWTYSDDDCNDFKCDACMASKAHKLPFPMSESRAALPLGLVHSDLLMFPEPSRWKAEVENASGAKIKTLRSDNGGEYTAFNKFCAEQGIRRDKSVPYTPEQNGRAERLNRSIVEGVLALFHDSGLPAHLWEEATQYYLDCKNLTPHAGIDGGVPDAIWHGIPQDLSRLRTFGCRAWATVPQHERTKLEPKGIPLIFSQRHVRGDRVPCRRATSLRARTALTRPYDRAAPRPGASFGTSRSCHTSNFSVAHASPPLSDSDHDSEDPNALLSHVVRSIADNASLDTAQVLAYAAHNASPEAPLDMLPSRDADPAHWHQAMRSPHAAEWQTEAIDEFTSLLNQYKVYDILDQAALPDGAKLLRSHFVFRTKRDQFGNVKSRKVRLVADGSTQRPGLDFQERYSPVVRFTSIRALVAIAVLRGYKIKQADVNKAYLHGKLDQPLYMRPPQGIDLPGKILKLERSIYGLKQAGRIWNDEIDSTLRSVGYKPTVSDLCVYTRRHGNDWHYIALYVDDLLLIGPSDDEIERVLSTLEDMYGIKRLGDAEYVLGIQLKRSDDGSITLSQERYLQDVLEHFDLALAKPASTPMQKNLLLELDQSTPSDQERTRYLQAIGSLMYAALGTRPDLAYAVSYLARFAKEPGPTHWTAIKHVLRYIRGTVLYGLRYTPTPGPLYGYSDSNWGACVRTSKSTMGYAYFLAGATISWCSKRSSRVAASTTDAEYIALSQSSKEAIHLQQLLEELGIPNSGPTLIYGDNQGAFSLTRNPTSFSGTRHVRIREHFVREMVKKGEIKVEYIATADMVSDILTKALDPKLFVRHRESLGLRMPGA